LDLPFICDVSYSKGLELLDLIPLCYWHEFLDLVFYFKCKNGIININGNVLPLIQNRERATRSADPDWLKFTTPKCRTAIFMARNAGHAPALYSGYLRGTWFN
jgi:hypothetical protein